MTLKKENKINRGPKKEKASWRIEKLSTGFERAQFIHNQSPKVIS